MKYETGNCNSCPFLCTDNEYGNSYCKFPNDDLNDDSTLIEEWDFPDSSDNITIPEKCGLRKNKVEVSLKNFIYVK